MGEARVAAAEEAARIAAEEAARLATEEAARIAAEEAERIAAEEKRQAEAEKIAAEAETARIAAEEEAKRMADEEQATKNTEDGVADPEGNTEPTLGDVENIDNQAATILVESVAKAAKDIVVNIIEAAQDTEEGKAETA